ncbi:MAG: ActR/PrrA/RegA family redox response regulator transcription factor [Alphaproteobacteria bacterium]|nr:ActR/PrrA/RegA family redox response regulator transcription factor [Alphaproteobacteria bacterium]
MTQTNPPLDKSLLIIDDDAPLRERLAKTMAKRGFTVSTADSIAQARASIRWNVPNYAIVDLKLNDGSGLEIVDEIHAANTKARVIVLTGYGNIATAVTAIKHGATDYLPKPADADAIERTLMNLNPDVPPPPSNPMSPDRVKWEHIQRVFSECNNNVSETARQLKMHRRTLQRILAKHAPRN